MFLHEDKELFKDVIEATAESQSQPIAIVEKDYYVTMILKLLSEKYRTAFLRVEHHFLSVIMRLTVFQKT